MTSKFSRRLMGGAVAASLAVGLAACTSAQPGESSPPAEPTSQAQSLRIGMNSGLVEPFQGYVDAFLEDRPDWDITVEAVPDAPAAYLQQVVAQNLSGDIPDILFTTDSLNQGFAGGNILADLKPWLEEGKGDLTLDGFQQNFLQLFAYQDAITGLPVSADSGMLLYNIDLFEKYGVADLPTADWTYDDMYSAAQQITDASGGEVYGIATPMSVGSSFFILVPILKAYGANLYDAESGQFVFANDNGLKAWETMLAPYIEGFGSPYTPDTPPIDYFTSGQAAMMIIARPGVAQVREALDANWQVEVLPQIQGNSTTGGGAYGLGIATASENQDAAWEFFSWFYATDGGMTEAVPFGVIPATVDGLESGAWRDVEVDVPSELMRVTEFAVANAILPDPLPDEVAPEVSPALREALERVLLQGVSPAEAYTDAQDHLNSLLGG